MGGLSLAWPPDHRCASRRVIDTSSRCDPHWPTITADTCALGVNQCQSLSVIDLGLGSDRIASGGTCFLVHAPVSGIIRAGPWPRVLRPTLRMRVSAEGLRRKLHRRRGACSVGHRCPSPSPRLPPVIARAPQAGWISQVCPEPARAAGLSLPSLMPLACSTGIGLRR